MIHSMFVLKIGAALIRDSDRMRPKMGNCAGKTTNYAANCEAVNS